mgnify:CR=1 FL=1
MKKIICLIAAIILLSGGFLGRSYYSFQTQFDEKISSRDLKSAKNLLEAWEKTRSCWLLKNIPCIKQNIAFEKGWIAAELGAYEEATKELRKAASIPSALRPQAIYNAATLALVLEKESHERLAEDYIRALEEKPDDFQVKVNLEIVRMLQKRAKQQAQQQGPGEGDGKDKKKMKKYRPGDKENQGSETGNEGVRY